MVRSPAKLTERAQSMINQIIDHLISFKKKINKSICLLKFILNWWVLEKHKSYHIKDEQLARDGFKKFMKNEACQFDNCRFSRVCNHIHCIREGCTYVLHSSGQLYSHKRKHERRDAELAYR